jgi:transcriptional regulator with XRE-family HTH domain
MRPDDWAFKKKRKLRLILGERLRQIRERKKLSQGDMERKTGLLRCYISRVENGYTVPAVGTLEKLARALEVPLYQLFFDADKPPEPPVRPKREKSARGEWGASGKRAQVWRRFHSLIGRMDQNKRNLLLSLAQKMASQSKR